MKLKLMAVVGLAIAAFPTSAQDISSPYDSAIADHGQLQLQSTLANRRLQQAQQRQRRSSSDTLSPKSRAICLDKKRVASRFPRAKAAELFALCAQAGY